MLFLCFRNPDTLLVSFILIVPNLSLEFIKLLLEPIPDYNFRLEYLLESEISLSDEVFKLVACGNYVRFSDDLSVLLAEISNASQCMIKLAKSIMMLPKFGPDVLYHFTFEVIKLLLHHIES